MHLSVLHIAMPITMLNVATDNAGCLNIASKNVVAPNNVGSLITSVAMLYVWYVVANDNVGCF